MAGHLNHHDQQQQSEDEIDELASIDELDDLDHLPTASTPPHAQLPPFEPTAEYANMANEADTDDWQPQTPPLPPQWQVEVSSLPNLPTTSHLSAQNETRESVPSPDAQLESKTPGPCRFADDTEYRTLETHMPSPSPKSSMAIKQKSQSAPDSPAPTSSEPNVSLPSSPAKAQAQEVEYEPKEEVMDDDVPRKSLFDIEDAEETQRIEEMYALLTATKQEADSDAESDESDAAYEARRQRKLLENQRLLAQLGLGPQAPVEEQESAPPSPSGSNVMLGSPSKPSKDLASPEPEKPKTKSRRRNGHWERKVLKLAEDGTTTTLPLPGTVHDLAYIDVLPVRERARDDYLFFDNFPIRAPTPTPPPTPIEKPRQTRASGSKPKETAPKMKAPRAKLVKTVDAGLTLSGKARQRRSKEEMAELDSKTAYSGTTCHQCRRKSLEPKMYCRQVGYIGELAAMQCVLNYCQGCCSVRYGITEDDDAGEQWDVGNPDWTCPRCRGICNCSLCMHKADMAHHLPQGGPGNRTLTLSSLLKDKSGKMKYRSVKHYLEEAMGVTQIGPKRILAEAEGSDSMRALLADIARLKEEVHIIRQRRRQRAVSRSASLPEDEGAEGYLDLPMDDKPTKRSRSASQGPSVIDVADALVEKNSRPKLTVKLRRPPQPVECTKDSLGATSTLAAIMAWQNSLDAHQSTVSNTGSAKERPSTRSHRLSKKSFEARESHVWIKGAADQYESDSDLDMLGDSAQGQDEEEAEERAASDDSTLTSLSELMSWRQSSPSCGAGVASGEMDEEQQDAHETTVLGASSPLAEDEEEEVTHEQSEETEPQDAPLQALAPPPFEQPFFSPSMQADSTSLEFSTRPTTSYLEPTMPQLSYSADASSASTSSSADFGLATRLASPWITNSGHNPYSAKGQGSLGVVSHFTHQSAHAHVPSQDISERHGQTQAQSHVSAGAGEDEEEEEEDAPLYPTTWPLRSTSSTDSIRSSAATPLPLPPQAALPPPPPPPPHHPTQMFFSPTSAWQHKTRT
ncbi:hypothetical protein BCV69DRAFT_281239 [Microstroma glucosiphilum]|uniref:Zinc-finger domain-containing protein n=1 Tax=Pseudomicrostroma glucosiphilum TaxID=1684307 RepID=A0A316UAH5_9BASI|nr:hypothetical protein BCV69DRAFT_281239 [Pseudomicrostroma glucosiphilum]PWN22230.1 hypothetical protein BCV69DRAFT_281239 [Pseudomicrostroma glucosiphilum]